MREPIRDGYLRTGVALLLWTDIHAPQAWAPRGMKIVGVATEAVMEFRESFPRAMAAEDCRACMFNLFISILRKACDENETATGGMQPRWR